MSDFSKAERELRKLARVLHEQAYELENAADAIKHLCQSTSCCTEAVIRARVIIHRWLEEHPS